MLSQNPLSKQGQFSANEMNAVLAAIGAFLLVLGISLIMAIPEIFTYTVGGLATLSVFVASVGGAVLAYAVASHWAKRP